MKNTEPMICSVKWESSLPRMEKWNGRKRPGNQATLTIHIFDFSLTIRETFGGIIAKIIFFNFLGIDHEIFSTLILL